MLLSSSSSVDFVYQYIARCMDHGIQQLGSLLGVVCIAPTFCTSVVPTLPIPLLVVTSPAPENGIYQRHVLVDPNVIVVVHDKIREPNISNFSESIALWFARTVAKAANAICALSNGRSDDSQAMKSRL